VIIRERTSLVEDNSGGVITHVIILILVSYVATGIAREDESNGSTEICDRKIDPYLLKGRFEDVKRACENRPSISEGG
jgi:hypothetical protein